MHFTESENRRKNRKAYLKAQSSALKYCHFNVCMCNIWQASVIPT